MDYDMTSATLAASDAGAEISQAALLWLLAFVLTSLSIVTIVAAWLKKHTVRYYTGQILVVSLAVVAPWPAWYDSDGGLLWLATVVGLALTAAAVLKHRKEWHRVVVNTPTWDKLASEFAGQLAVFDDDKVRPDWMQKKS